MASRQSPADRASARAADSRSSRPRHPARPRCPRAEGRRRCRPAVVVRVWRHSARRHWVQQLVARRPPVRAAPAMVRRRPAQVELVLARRRERAALPAVPARAPLARAQGERQRAAQRRHRAPAPVSGSAKSRGCGLDQGTANQFAWSSFPAFRRRCRVVSNSATRLSRLRCAARRRHRRRGYSFCETPA